MTTLIPYDCLQPTTLHAVIEEFVTRDGAVHGHADTPLADQIESVRHQLISGKVVIIFDDESESCTICLAQEWGKGSPGPVVSPNEPG